MAPVVALRGDRGWASSQAAVGGSPALVPGASGFRFSHPILGLLKAALWNNYELRLLGGKAKGLRKRRKYIAQGMGTTERRGRRTE